MAQPGSDTEERPRKHDPNFIDGDKWFEALLPCSCGQTPEVWRTYVEVQGTRRYAVRCHPCNHHVERNTRQKAIRTWNEIMSPDQSGRK